MSKKSFGLFIGVLCLAVVLPAQEFRGSIRGTVTDPSGALIPDAKITITNLATGTASETRSNAEGNYQIPFLLPGNYSIVAEHTGFKKADRSNVRVGTAEQVELDLRMEVGSPTETVTITGEAPLLTTTGADLGQTVSTTYITDVVTSVYRNAFNLSRMAAGITGAPQGTYTSDNMSQVSINGGAGTQGRNEVMVDGVPNAINQGGGNVVVVPTVDSIEEMKVHTTMFDASYGHSNGGAIDIVTKGGSNQPHGAVDFFKRWSSLYANSWGNNRTAQPRPPIHYRLYSYFFSGPVYLPKVYDGRNKTFFSTSFEDDFDNRNLSRNLRVPTDLERIGNFSQTLARNGKAPVVIYDPGTTVIGSDGRGTRTPFQNGIIPASRLNPNGLAVLAALPPPNLAVTPQVGAFNWSIAKSYHVGQREVSARVDHTISDRQRLFARYSKLIRAQAADELIRGIDGGSDTDTYNQWRHSVVLDDTYTFSPTLFGSLRFGFTRRDQFEYWGAVGLDPGELKVADIVVQNQTIKGWPTYNLGESMPTLGSRTSKPTSDTYSLFTTATKLHGNHNLKFGLDYRLMRYSTASQGAQGAGTWNFDSGFTRNDFSTAASGDTGGTAMASLLLGVASGGQFGYTSPLSLQQHYAGLFVQDDWKVGKRLTLNFGLRYELETPYTERYNRVAYGFDPAAALPIKVPGLNLHGGALFAGVNGNPRGEGIVDKNNFGPRFGFAYKAMSKTVVRGGYGFFYSGQTINISGVGSIGSFDALTPYVGSTNGGATPYTTIANPFPTGLVKAVGSSIGVMAQAGDSLSFINQNRVSPYNQQWQFSVQRELPLQSVFEAAYVGSLGIKGLETFDLNELPDNYLAQGAHRNDAVSNPFLGVLPASSALGQGATVPQSRLWVAFPQFTSVNASGLNSGNASYHSLQVRVEKRLSRGLSAVMTYTFSKLIDNNTTSFVNARHYRSISNLDQPHLFRFVTSYDFPFRFAGQQPVNRFLLRPVLAGWSLTNFLIIESGTPMGISENNGRPLMTADPRIDGAVGDRLGDKKDAQGNIINPYFKLDAFQALPTQYMVSPQAPYNSWFRSPLQVVTNAALMKRVAIYERMHLEVRLETVNTTNHPYYNAPGTNMSSRTTFGSITGAGNSRTVQGGLKLLF